MEYREYIVIFAGTFVVGYLMCRLLVLMLPRRLMSDNIEQKAAVMETARMQARNIRQENADRTQQRIQMLREDLDAQIKNRIEDLELEEQDLEAREGSLQVEEARLRLVERDNESHAKRVEFVAQVHGQRIGEWETLGSTLVAGLEKASGCESATLRNLMAVNEIEGRRLEQQRSLKLLTEDLATSSAKMAGRVLDRALFRYAPGFVWPKATSHVEIPDPRLIDLLRGEQAAFLRELHELAEVEVDLIEPAPGSPQQPTVKVAGGAGMDREAVKLVLAEAFVKGPVTFAKAKAMFEKHRRHVDEQALKLGRQAVNALGLKELHQELQKMIGSLYWRTSYRQNQYYHSLEVANVAGVVAAELGIDPQLAKRCGVLHDIGKSIDHKIEGSHAVISADYAGRFGEDKVVCDTVMSHHNDIVLETPLAFLLKCADTISGARPGARVNIEEGYQIRLSAIEDAVRSFPGTGKMAIMNGGREVHIDINPKRVRENELQGLSTAIAKKIEEEVAFPGQIKILLSRRFEASAST